MENSIEGVGGWVGECKVLNLVLKIFPRFLRQSRSDVLLLAFMHIHFILLILLFERDQVFHKRACRRCHHVEHCLDAILYNTAASWLPFYPKSPHALFLRSLLSLVKRGCWVRYLSVKVFTYNRIQCKTIQYNGVVPVGKFIWQQLERKKRKSSHQRLLRTHTHTHKHTHTHT